MPRSPRVLISACAPSIFDSLMMFVVKIAVSVFRMGLIGEIAIKVLYFLTKLASSEVVDCLKNDIFESNSLN